MHRHHPFGVCTLAGTSKELSSSARRAISGCCKLPACLRYPSWSFHYWRLFRAVAHRVLSGALPVNAEWQDSATRANAAQADVGCCDVTSLWAGRTGGRPGHGPGTFWDKGADLLRATPPGGVAWGEEGVAAEVGKRLPTSLGSVLWVLKRSRRNGAQELQSVPCAREGGRSSPAADVAALQTALFLHSVASLGEESGCCQDAEPFAVPLASPPSCRLAPG